MLGRLWPVVDANCIFLVTAVGLFHNLHMDYLHRGNTARKGIDLCESASTLGSCFLRGHHCP